MQSKTGCGSAEDKWLWLCMCRWCWSGWKCLSLPFGEGIQCVEAVLVPWWSTKTGNVTFVDGGYIFIRSTH